MNLRTTRYLKQVAQLPKSGCHIVAQYDDNGVVVYQAYRPAIAHFAIQHGYFGGEFSLNRMSWIKPNFLWMMYRAGWATKPGQEVVLAVHIKRAAFETILAGAVHASFVSAVYPSRTAWQQAVAQSLVRLQWDPDHDPAGNKQARRAIQLGLRGVVLAQYARDWIIRIEDMSEFVREQYQIVQSGDWQNLSVPSEAVYPVTDPAVAKRLQLSELCIE